MRGIRWVGKQRSIPRSRNFRAPFCSIAIQTFLCTAILRRSKTVSMTQLTFLSEEHLAKPSASLDFARDFPTSAAISHLSLFVWLKGFVPAGWFGKMSLAYCPSTEDGRLEASSEGWQNAGMGSPTGFLTLSISECHSAAAVCSLSDILETGDMQRRYYLSATACAGIAVAAVENSSASLGNFRTGTRQRGVDAVSR